MHAVQFHPESISSEHGLVIMKNFLDMADAWNKGPRSKNNPAFTRT